MLWVTIITQPVRIRLRMDVAEVRSRVKVDVLAIYWDGEKYVVKLLEYI